MVRLRVAGGVRRPSAARASLALSGNGAGFTLAALIIAVAVLNVMIAASLPVWSQMIQRDKEKELIFRGLQYAEAIRIFQQRHGRYPVRLDELLKVHPRSIRQLWKDPVTDSEEWGLIFAQANRRAGAREAPGQTLAGGGGALEEQEERERRARENRQRFSGSGGGRQGETVTVGPIVGVFSRSEKDSIVEFMGSAKHSDWKFTVDLLPVPVVNPGTLVVLGANSDRIGRPFPRGLEPKLPGGLQQGKGPAQRKSSRRRRGS